MKNALRILLIVAIVSLVGSAYAQGVSWNYVEGGWITVDPDGGSSEDGWLLGGSVELGKVPIHLFGEFNDLGDVDIWQLGGGWHGGLGERADLFADGAFYDADVEDGFRVRFGVRWMVLEKLELNGFLSWTELDFSDNKSIAANAIWGFSKNFGVGGGIELGDNWNAARIFVRFSF